MPKDEIKRIKVLIEEWETKEECLDRLAKEYGDLSKYEIIFVNDEQYKTRSKKRSKKQNTFNLFRWKET